MEAKEALENVLQKRGGLEALVARLKAQQTIETEKARIINEVSALGRKGVDVGFLKTTISSAFFSPQQVNELVDGAYQQMELERADRRIKPRTVIGGIFGTLLAAIIGGALWGIVLIYAPARLPILIYVILLFGLFSVCYGIIKLLTRQSRKNIIVLVCTILAVLQAVLIGGSIADLSKIL